MREPRGVLLILNRLEIQVKVIEEGNIVAQSRLVADPLSNNEGENIFAKRNKMRKI